MGVSVDVNAKGSTYEDPRQADCFTWNRRTKDVSLRWEIYRGVPRGTPPATARLSNTTSRLRKDASSGYVAFHASVGVTLSDGSEWPEPLKRKIWPPGFVNACRVPSTRASTRTARIVTRSCASWRSGRAR